MDKFNKPEEFTLEDDDCNELFITQTPKDNLVDKDNLRVMVMDLLEY